MPVTAALPSVMDRGRLMRRQNRASVPTAARMEARITNRAFHPYTITPTMAAGTRLSSTVCMMKEVVHRSRTWGLADRFSVMAYFPPPWAAWAARFLTRISALVCLKFCVKGRLAGQM